MENSAPQNFDLMTAIDIADAVTVNSHLKQQIIQNMHSYGGNFVKALATAMVIADGHNVKRLAYTFCDYMREYHPTKWGANKSAGSASNPMLILRQNMTVKGTEE